MRFVCAVCVVGVCVVVGLIVEHGVCVRCVHVCVVCGVWVLFGLCVVVVFV